MGTVTSPSQAYHVSVLAFPEGVAYLFSTSTVNDIPSNEECHESSSGEWDAFKPSEPETAALAEGTVASTPREEKSSMSTKPMLARCCDVFRGLRSLIVLPFHP